MVVRILPFLLLFFSQLSLSQGGLTCSVLQPNNEEIFQEIIYKKWLACIYSSTENKETVIIRFFKKEKNAYHTIAKNSTLLRPDEMHSNPPTLEATNQNRFQIVYSFPRDTYVIGLQAVGSKISLSKIYKSIRLNLPEEDPITITISKKESALEKLKFETITQANAFNSGSMQLSPTSIGEKVKISAMKATLFNGPSPDKKTNSYLIKNDEIELIEVSGEWLYVRYKSKTTIEKWINISDIL